MKRVKIVSFDADDTLWVNETYYQDIEKEFVLMIANYSNIKAVTDAIHKKEISNLEIYGYGAKGFMLSMLETALEVSKGKVSSEELNRIIEMGRGLINAPIVLLDGVKETLEKLASAGYKLIVTTKGDLLDQQRKLDKSGLGKYFDHIEIMSYKTEQDYIELLKHLGVMPDEFIMIGNSMKSDILPILNIGGYGIHIPFHTTWAHEIVDNVGKQEKLWVVKHISEVAEILKA